MINLTDGVTVASIAKVRDKDPEADTTAEKADGETDDNEEDPQMKLFLQAVKKNKIEDKSWRRQRKNAEKNL